MRACVRARRTYVFPIVVFACERASVRACVCASERACVRACVRASERACVRVGSLIVNLLSLIGYMCLSLLLAIGNIVSVSLPQDKVRNDGGFHRVDSIQTQ